ncbi:MAG: hypothetical protein HN348_21550 [Proteobacteria bacterium]|nr:hypothetical protein [Pseudomonadota bacterium]
MKAKFCQVSVMGWDGIGGDWAFDLNWDSATDNDVWLEDDSANLRISGNLYHL